MFGVRVTERRRRRRVGRPYRRCTQTCRRVPHPVVALRHLRIEVRGRRPCCGPPQILFGRMPVRSETTSRPGACPMTHGTWNTYTKARCRCDRCHEAALEYKRRWRRSQGIPEARRGRTCGTVSCYVNGCRCDDCRRAARDRKRRERLRYDLPFGCLDCPATFQTQAAATRHSEYMHFGRHW